MSRMPSDRPNQEQCSYTEGWREGARQCVLAAGHAGDHDLDLGDRPLSVAAAAAHSASTREVAMTDQPRSCEHKKPAPSGLGEGGQVTEEWEPTSDMRSIVAEVIGKNRNLSGIPYPAEALADSALRAMYAQGWRPASRVEELEAALRDAVSQVSQGRRGIMGPSTIHSPQISVQAVERWRALLKDGER